MKTIGLFFGGLSNEAAVSVMSAKNIVKHFDYRRYRLALIYWHKKDGFFYKIDNIDSLRPRPRQRIEVADFSHLFDIALLMTHGRYGEDGVLQAILESQKKKYCGCGVLSSALCMDKAVFKNMLAGRGIRQVRYQVLDFNRVSPAGLAAARRDIIKRLRLPVYVKPANSGSSVGITKVEKIKDLDQAILVARRHDSKIVVEEGLVNPTEVEVGVLGNDQLIVSRPGELRLVKDFYDYDDKYKLGEAQTVVPAKISVASAREVRKLAAAVYRLADCRGFARVDFFISRGCVYLNEINTLPGFTDISMFPLVMMNQGMSYQELINKIISLAK